MPSTRVVEDANIVHLGPSLPSLKSATINLDQCEYFQGSLREKLA